MTAKAKNIGRNIIVEPLNNLIYIDGQVKRIDPLLMRMLMHFYHHQGQLVDRQTFCDQVWRDRNTSYEAVNISVSRLRKLLGGDLEDFIKTVPRKGYQFDLPEEGSFTVVSNSSQGFSPAGETGERPRKKPNRIFNSVPVVLAGVVLLLISITVLWHGVEQPDIVVGQTKFPIPLALAPIRSNEPGLVTVHRLLRSRLQLSNKIRIDTDHKHQYTVDVNIKSHQPHLQLVVTIKNKLSETLHSSQLNFAADALNQNHKTIVDELAAYVRLILVYNGPHNPLLKAYQPLSYSEVEQLVMARQFSAWHERDKLVYAWDVASKLNEKYPGVPLITGLLARLSGRRAGFDDVDIVEAKRQELNKAIRTLSAEPGNFDALYSAFLYHRNFAPLRHKARDYANLLTQYYPNKPQGWRNQLLVMIDNKQPCDKIAAFVAIIPKGVFKDHRLNLINQILDICLSERSVETIYNQISYLPNSKQDKAIFNNMKLFGLRHDKLWLPDSRHSLLFSGPLYDTVYFFNQLKRQDKQNAGLYLQKIMKTKNRYWQWFAQAYQSLYEPPRSQTQAQQLWRDDYYQLLQNDAEITFAAYLIKQLSTNRASKARASKARIEQYLIERPDFSIDIMNRKESIAKIMLLYHGGHVEQAQSAAEALYRQLERNYQTSPSSFRFWNLGSYHLIARLYCGQDCDAPAQSTEQYLDEIFSRHHVWWLDDLKFMTVVLSPWAQNDLVEGYLQKVESSLKRMQLNLGIKP